MIDDNVPPHIEAFIRQRAAYHFERAQGWLRLLALLEEPDFPRPPAPPPAPSSEASDERPHDGS